MADGQWTGENPAKLAGGLATLGLLIFQHDLRGGDVPPKFHPAPGAIGFPTPRQPVLPLMLNSRPRSFVAPGGRSVEAGFVG